MTFNHTSKTVRQTQIPFFPTADEGGIQAKTKTLTAKWTTDNKRRLVCQWISK